MIGGMLPIRGWGAEWTGNNVRMPRVSGGFAVLRCEIRKLQKPFTLKPEDAECPIHRRKCAAKCTRTHLKIEHFLMAGMQSLHEDA